METRNKNKTAGEEGKECWKWMNVSSFYTENPVLTKKKKMMTKEKLPPANEHRCCRNDGKGWRCKKIRMIHDGDENDSSAVHNTKLCEKHHFEYLGRLKKKRSGDDGDAGCSKWRRKKVTQDDCSDDDTENQSDTTPNRIIDSDPTNVEGIEWNEAVESLTGIGEVPVVEYESLEHYKSRCIELSVELETKKMECTKLQGATECLRKMFSDLESRVLKMEKENSTLGCVDSRITNLEILESRVLKIEEENSTLGCVESRISNLESLVLKSAKENSTLRCVELPNSENIESQAPGLQNDVTIQFPRAETSSGGRKDSHVYDVGVQEQQESESEFPKYSAMNISAGSIHISSAVENVEEGKGLGCLEEKLYESSSQDHLEMSEKLFVNLISDDDGESSCEIIGENSETFVNSESPIGHLMDMMATTTCNKNQDKEIERKCEADMLSSFEEDPELSMKAVCALYRQHIAETSAKGVFHDNDVVRSTTLAKFLMDGSCQGELKKSVKELQIFDSDGVEDCKRLARTYSNHLFRIYQNGKDLCFLPALSASHRDQTSN